MPADASPAATDRPEPPGGVDVERRETGVTVPPPRLRYSSSSASASGTPMWLQTFSRASGPTR